MSQFYDQASLVMVPSGYKAGKVYSQKPLSTDGELTFTRNSNATRVNADGLVEKVRTNLLLQSNTFSTSPWVNVNYTLTSGQSGYDGSNNAWLANKTDAGNIYIRQSFVNPGQCTASIYAKAGTLPAIMLYTDNGYAVYNLTTGALINSGGAPLSYKAEAVANGFYRISVTASGTGNFYFKPTDASGGNTTGSIYVQNGQLELSDFGPTDYIPTTSAAVSVGPTANVPRLDYSGGCPSLLLEPQRTNNATFNERLASGTFSYVDGVTFTANSITAPTGYTQGCKFEKTGSGVADRYDALGGGPMSQSIFVKAGTSSRIVLAIEGNVTGSVIFDLSTLGITNYGTATGKIVDFGNGWYRCIANYSATPTSGPITRIYLPDTGYLYCYGYQMELNASYETSLIPTLGASVTRLADAAYKTGISSLIGQTEGTIYIEADMQQNDAGWGEVVRLQGATIVDSIVIYFNPTGQFYFEIMVGGVSQASGYLSYAGGNLKIAIAYKANDVIIYINGTADFADTSASIPTCDKFYLLNGPAAQTKEGGVKQALLFKTRLTNAQLAELTTF